MQKKPFYIVLFCCWFWLLLSTNGGAQESVLPIKEQRLLEKGIALYNAGEYAKASTVFDQLLISAEQAADTTLLGEIYFRLGNFYQENELLPQSLEFLLRSSHLLTPPFATERSNILVPTMEEGPATYLLDIPKDAALICEVYNKIGGVYFKQQNYKKAEKYWKKAYQVAEQYKSAKALSDVCNNLGELERLKGQPVLALNYYHRALDLQQTMKDSIGILVSWGNIGSIHLKNSQLDSSKWYFDKAYQMAEQLQDSSAQLESYLDYGAYYQQQKNIKEALKWTHLGLAIAEKREEVDLRLEAHRRLAQLYQEQKNWDALLVHQERWTTLQQEQTLKNRKKLTMQIEAEYIVHQQEKELLRLQQEARIKQEKGGRLALLQGGISGGLLLLLLGTLGYLLTKRKHTKTLTAHLHKIELQNTERETLLQEIHHRVKNNLQVVTSLLHLQSYDIKDPAIKLLFDKSQYRIGSMAMIHEMLYQSHELSAIDYKEYLHQLVNKLLRAIKGKDHTVQLDMEVAPIRLNMDTAIPLGLIINELVTNALKYGLDKKESSILLVHLRRAEEGAYWLEIGDNGIGMAEDWTQGSQPSSLGLRLVRKLTRQLEGELVKLPKTPGTHYRLHFKEVTTIG